MVAGYTCEWDPRKGASNARKHGVTFDEASTVFGDPLAPLMRDPDHSRREERYVLLGEPARQKLLVVAFVERPLRGMSGDDMKKRVRSPKLNADRDTLRPEYDFSTAVRGVAAKRYAQGANVAVIDPDLLDVFPHSRAVNQALRALAPILRQQRQGAR
jgi:uncharacterized DUF497 family protein